MYRIRANFLNSYLALVVDPKLQSRLTRMANLSNQTVIVNIYEFIESQLLANVHKYIGDIRTSEFRKAKRYLTAVCEETVYQYDEESKSSFITVAKALIIDLSIVQMLLTSTYPNVSFVVTAPPAYLDKLSGLPSVITESTIGMLPSPIVKVQDFVGVLDVMSNTDTAIADALEVIAAFYPACLKNLDIAGIYKNALTGNTPMIDQRLAQLYLVSKGVISFGGIYEDIRI